MHKYIFFICLEDLWLQNLTLWVYVVHQFSGVIHNDFYLKGLKYKELLLWIEITISFRWLLVWGSRVSWISTRLEQAMALGVGWKTKRFQSSAGGRILPSSILPHHEMVWVTSEVSGGLLILSLEDETKSFLKFSWISSLTNQNIQSNLFRTWRTTSTWTASSQVKSQKSGRQSSSLRIR